MKNHSKNTSLHAIKSVMREAEKGILKISLLGGVEAFSSTAIIGVIIN
jgi:hypothetical protein